MATPGDIRPNEEDMELLVSLLNLDDKRLPTPEYKFIASLDERLDEDEQLGRPLTAWSEKQCQWFDDLCERYL